MYSITDKTPPPVAIELTANLTSVSFDIAKPEEAVDNVVVSLGYRCVHDYIGCKYFYFTGSNIRNRCR